MININEIKEGDTVILRNRIKEKVVRMGNDLTIGGFAIQYWRENGSRNFNNSPSGFDIIAIEKKPEPKQLIVYIAVDIEGCDFDWGFCPRTLKDFKDKYKITFTEGEKPTIEAVEA